MRGVLFLSAHVAAANYDCNANAFNWNSGLLTKGPAGPAQQPAWLKGLRQWKSSCRRTLGLDGAIFEEPALKWTTSAFVQTQMHPYDLTFWSPVTRRYTFDAFLGDLEARYGGIDALLIWPTYTNIGVDDRNAMDMIRAMPLTEGFEALEGVEDLRNFESLKRGVVGPLHERGQHVRAEHATAQLYTGGLTGAPTMPKGGLAAGAPFPLFNRTAP